MNTQLENPTTPSTETIACPLCADPNSLFLRCLYDVRTDKHDYYAHWYGTDCNSPHEWAGEIKSYEIRGWTVVDDIDRKTGQTEGFPREDFNHEPWTAHEETEEQIIHCEECGVLGRFHAHTEQSGQDMHDLTPCELNIRCHNCGPIATQLLTQHLPLLVQHITESCGHALTDPTD